MKTKTLQFFLLAVFTTVLVIVSASCKSKQERVVMGMVKEVEHFPKIKDVKAELDIVSSLRTFNINEPALLTFRLTNFSVKKLIIYEWKMIDELNITLYVAPWVEGQPYPAPEKWICLKPDAKKARLMTLDLATNNFTLVDKKIDFKNEIIKSEIEKPQTFLVYGELNLESVSLKTAPTKLTINP